MSSPSINNESKSEALLPLLAPACTQRKSNTAVQRKEGNGSGNGGAGDSSDDSSNGGASTERDFAVDGNGLDSVLKVGSFRDVVLGATHASDLGGQSRESSPMKHNVWSEFHSSSLEREFQDDCCSQGRTPFRIYLTISALFFIYETVTELKAPQYGIFCKYQPDGHHLAAYCPPGQGPLYMTCALVAFLLLPFTYSSLYPKLWCPSVLGAQCLFCAVNAHSVIIDSTSEIVGLEDEMATIKFLLLNSLIASTHLFMLRLPLRWIALCCACMFVSGAAVITPLMLTKGLDSYRYRHHMEPVAIISMVALALGFVAQKTNDRRSRLLFWHKAQLQLELHVEQERRKRKQAEVKATAVHNLIAYLCHEVRNPFAGVKGWAERIGEVCSHQEMPLVCRWAAYIMHASEHVENILNNSLDLSKHEYFRVSGLQLQQLVQIYANTDYCLTLSALRS
jgi:hypothetical protein